MSRPNAVPWTDAPLKWCAVCGRGSYLQRHHIIYQQHLEPKDRRDGRNCLVICKACHDSHHNRQKPVLVELLPSSVFEFGVEVLGAERLYEYLRRYYTDDGDARLARLIEPDAERPAQLGGDAGLSSCRPRHGDRLPEQP